MENSVTILSNAGLGMAMFSLGRSIIIFICFDSLFFSLLGFEACELN